MEEVPLSQRPLLALDDEKCLAGEHEEVLLVGLPVVHPYRVTRPEHAKEDADLLELRLTLELAARRPALGMKPAGVASVQHEPAVPGRYDPGLGALERCLWDHPQIIWSARHLPRRIGNSASPAPSRLGRSRTSACDDSEQASHGGELAGAVEARVVTRRDVTELGAVLIGEATGRDSADDITLFDSTGLAIQDLAIAKAAYAKARELELPRITL
jgi:hypothetical protein